MTGVRPWSRQAALAVKAEARREKQRERAAGHHARADTRALAREIASETIGNSGEGAMDARAATELVLKSFGGLQAVASLSPKDVMLVAMRINALIGAWAKAANIAADVATFVHPKLANVTYTPVNDESLKSTEELRRELIALRGVEGAADQANALAETLPRRFDKLVH